ncbi:mucin-associated surface protein (MASP), partial [Trypanosoma cruzi]
MLNVSQTNPCACAVESCVFSLFFNFLFSCFLIFWFAGRCASFAFVLIPFASLCVLRCCCNLTLYVDCGVVWQPCLSFLLSLCFDVLLVCAEGYTQVTGVMAMMMTGRVLLVCVLCVPWCGLSGIAADGVGGGDGSADGELLLQWRNRLRRECAEEVSRRTGGSGNASAVDECVRQAMESVRAVVDGRRRWRRQRIAVVAASAAAAAA